MTGRWAPLDIALAAALGLLAVASAATLFVADDPSWVDDAIAGGALLASLTGLGVVGYGAEVAGLPSRQDVVEETQRVIGEMASLALQVRSVDRIEKEGVVSSAEAREMRRAYAAADIAAAWAETDRLARNATVAGAPELARRLRDGMTVLEQAVVAEQRDSGTLH